MLTLPVCMAKAKESGNPFFIELYVLNLRNGVLRIAACDEDIVFAGDTYTAVPFQRGEITRSIDNIIDSCELTLGDVDFEMLKYVMNGFDFRGCEAYIARIQYPESLTDTSVCQLIFAGIIDEPSYSNGTFTVKVKSRLPEIECPNRNFRLACNSEFGDAECGMSLEKTKVTIAGASGNKVTLQGSFPTDKWKDGVMTVSGESRLIEANDGNTITLNVNFMQNLTGKTAELQRGCNKTVECCRKYNNMSHYGGFPAIPFESSYH